MIHRPTRALPPLLILAVATAGCAVPGFLGGGVDAVSTYRLDGPRPTDSTSSAATGPAVFLITIDGLRYQDAFAPGAPAGLRRMTGDLAASGTFFSRVINDGVTNTMSGHATLFTGHWESVKKWNFLFWEGRADHPTIFEFARRDLDLAPQEALLAVGEQKLSVLDHGGDDGLEGRVHPIVLEPRGIPWRRAVPFPLPLPDLPETADRRLVERTLELTFRHRPRLVALEIPGADAAAHRGDRDGYLGSLRRADALVGEVWDRLSAHPAYRDRTYVVVTADHGRHLDHVADGFRGHGDRCAGCRHTTALVLGPGVEAGVRVDGRKEQVDIAPTVLKLLGIEGAPVESMQGKPLPLDWTTIGHHRDALRRATMPARIP